MKVIIYMGFNNPLIYKRGVENVIETQALSAPPHAKKYYLFFAEEQTVFRWGSILCIGIRKGLPKFLAMNAIVKRIYRKSYQRGDKVIVHSHHHLMTSFLLRRTNLLTVHDGLWYLKKCFHTRAPRLFWAMERWMYYRSDVIQCNSNFTYQNSQLPDVGRPSRIIYCSTPLEIYASQNKSPFPASRTNDVLSVRSIEERARIDLIVEVAALAQGEKIPLKFTICGKGPLLEHYRSEVLSRKLDNIQLLGYVADLELISRYQSCNCVLMTCENGEGFGMPTIEAYLFGKPVIGSARCAVPEIISDQEWLVNNSATEILAKLVDLHKNQQPSSHFSNYYQEKFSFPVISRQFRALYDEVFSLR